MTATDEFETHRAHLVGVAYRLLGSLADAEDVVQDAWLRLRRVDPDEIDDLRGWLTTVTGRLCLDVLRSARVRREAYVGPWLPEPLVSEPLVNRLPDGRATDPAELAVLDESVRMALLVVLERLTPEQRVAFVLHDVFGTPFDAVAAVLDASVEAARQHASRARRAVQAERPRQAVPAAEHRAVLGAFLAAARDGDLDGLLRVLAPDVVLTSDGGGIVRAALRPVEGSDKVARLVLGLMKQAGDAEALFEPATVNGAPGAVIGLRPPGGEPVLLGVLTADALPDGRIGTIALVVNPEKLTRVPSRWPVVPLFPAAPRTPRRS